MDKSKSDNKLSPCCVPPVSVEKGASENSKSAKLLQSQDLANGARPSRLISLPAGRGIIGTNKPLLAMDDDGTKLTSMVEARIRAVEFEELEERLVALETHQ